MPRLQQIVDDAGQPVVIKAFAQRVVERHAQPAIDPLDVVQAGRQNSLPQPQVLRIAGVQLGRLGQHGRADVGMLGGQLRQLGIGFDRGQLALAARPARSAASASVGFGAGAALWPRFLCGLGVAGRRWRGSARQLLLLRRRSARAARAARRGLRDSRPADCTSR